MAKKNKKIYFIDGNAFCYRAFYAIKELTTSRGVPTNAIYGFINIFHKLIKQEVPDMLVAVFDSPGETDRHKKYEEYKIHRKPMPDDLVEQLPWIKKVVQAYNVPIYELKGYEADDIIATLAEQAKENDVDVTIVTSDKDALQLVGDKVQVLSSHAFGDKVYGSGDVKEKYGVGPELMVDLMALTGDTSDNVPGVKGIGKITASKLINQYGSLKGVYENLETLSSSSTGKKLSENKEMAELSRELVELNRNVPVVLDLNRAKVIEPDTEKLAELYAKFEFVKLLREITPVLDAPTGEYNEIVSDKDISDFSERVKRHGKLCMVLSLKSPGEEGSGAALSFQANSPLFISFLKKGIPEKIKELLEDKNIKKTGYDLKRDKIKLKKYGICLEGIDFDVMIADYLTDPANISYELSAIVMRHLGRSFSGKAEKASEMCQNNRIIYDLADKLNVILEEKRLGTLFTGTEMPLVEILAEMEIEGVTVDRKCLKERSESLGKELGKITKKIYELAGQEFNINSPKQLQTVLYEKLELPVMKKTKTGFSTDESVLR
ncbi:MAG: hypothetical protein KAI70_00100, partial [Candidatus Omnitrophica bacterium]|nr:hypothetical protein [Candidatus Omnitrophota bacterium]